MKKLNKNKPPRYWKSSIRAITGLNFCDSDCGCGDNNQLWWMPTTPEERRHLPTWLPGWMNGADTFDIWKWLVENKHARSTR